MKIKKADDKPMVIHTKEKAKIHSHEPKGARIQGSNIYTVERGPKIAGAKAAKDTAKTVAKETAKETAKTTAKVAAKTATKTAAAAAGTAVAPIVGLVLLLLVLVVARQLWLLL